MIVVEDGERMQWTVSEAVVVFGRGDGEWRRRLGVSRGDSGGEWDGEWWLRMVNRGCEL